MQIVYPTNKKEGIPVIITDSIHKKGNLNTKLRNCISFFKLKKIAEYHSTQHK